jgi:hypothetical protein
MKHLPWVYLLIFFIGILILNIHLTNEGFYAKSFAPFSEYLLSLITIDPDADYKCHTGSNLLRDASGNTIPSAPPPSRPPPPPPPSTPPPPAPPKDNADEKTRQIINQLKHEIDEEIRNQKIQSRHEPINVTVTAPAPSCPSMSIVSDPPVPSSSTAPLPPSSLEQGQECIQSNPVTDCQRKDLSALDMSDYIRKDSIPCWGCSGL